MGNRCLSGNGYVVIDYIDLSIPQLHEVLRVKNLPEFLQWDRDSHTVSWEEHLKFISSLIGDEKRKYYAIYKDGKYVGTINFREEENGVWSRGIGTVPNLQGKGETMKWETQVLSALSRDEYKKIIADVRIDNVRSLRYHEKMGYTETGRNEEYIFYEKIL